MTLQERVFLLILYHRPFGSRISVVPGIFQSFSLHQPSIFALQVRVFPYGPQGLFLLLVRLSCQVSCQVTCSSYRLFHPFSFSLRFGSRKETSGSNCWPKAIENLSGDLWTDGLTSNPAIWTKWMIALVDCQSDKECCIVDLEIRLHVKAIWYRIRLTDQITVAFKKICCTIIDGPDKATYRAARLQSKKSAAALLTDQTRKLTEPLVCI